MNTYQVITKIKTEELKEEYKEDLSHIYELGGTQYFDVKTYLETHKYIIETNDKKNIKDYFKGTDHRIVSTKPIDSKSNTNSNYKGKKKTETSSTFTLGEIFKEQLAEFSEKQSGEPYTKCSYKKRLTKKFLKIERRNVNTKK